MRVDRRWSALTLLMFVLSGVAGLIFEVALQRSLNRAFGVSAFATSTVLAAWMTGTALGAVLFGRTADRSRAPLKLYAWLELGIAAAAIVSPFVIGPVIDGFAKLATGLSPASPVLLLGRFVLAFSVTLVPTLLMGGTLPTVARALAQPTESGVPSDSIVARLYTANLFGAVAGSVLGAYVALPNLGLSKTMWLGAACNVAAALLAFFLARGLPDARAEVDTSTTRAPRALLALSWWSGLATFIAEVTWFQLLAVVVGTSAYAFGLMLATFLIGLAFGSAWVARRTDEQINFALIGKVQLVVALVLTLTLPLWDRVPNLFMVAGTLNPGFWGREAVRAIACFELLLIPSAALGALFPLVLRLGWRFSSRGSSLGGLSAFNTLGAVMGSIATGFVLLPQLGSRLVLMLIVIACASIAVWLLKGRQRLYPVAVLVLLALLPNWNYGKLASGANVYFTQTIFDGAEVLWAHESVESGLTSVVQLPGLRTLLTNGKFQGNDGGESNAQRAFTQTPMLLQKSWGRALLIGVGTGCTLGVLGAQPFEHVEAAELSTDILHAARTYFGSINDRVLETDRATIHHADGRNLLLLSPHTYDLISLEISSIWFAGAADLYSREFYELASRKLSDQGLLQQWVQLHHLSRRDLAVILQSIRTAFPHVVMLESGHQGIVLASKSPLVVDYAAITALNEKLGSTPAYVGMEAGDLLTMRGHVVLDEKAVGLLIAEEAQRAGLPIERFQSTDDSLWLEYSTPRGNADDSLDVDSLLASLKGLPLGPLPILTRTDEEATHARAAFEVGRGNLAGATAELSALRSIPAAKKLVEYLEHPPAPEE